MNFFFDVFTALALAVPGDLSTLPGDAKFLTELLTFLIAGAFNGLELFPGQVTSRLELRFLQEKGLGTFF